MLARGLGTGHAPRRPGAVCVLCCVFLFVGFVVGMSYASRNSARAAEWAEKKRQREERARALRAERKAQSAARTAAYGDGYTGGAAPGVPAQAPMPHGGSGRGGMGGGYPPEVHIGGAPGSARSFRGSSLPSSPQHDSLVRAYASSTCLHYVAVVRVGVDCTTVPHSSLSVLSFARASGCCLLCCAVLCCAVLCCVVFLPPGRACSRPSSPTCRGLSRFSVPGRIPFPQNSNTTTPQPTALTHASSVKPANWTCWARRTSGAAEEVVAPPPHVDHPPPPPALLLALALALALQTPPPWSCPQAVVPGAPSSPPGATLVPRRSSGCAPLRHDAGAAPAVRVPPSSRRVVAVVVVAVAVVMVAVLAVVRPGTAPRGHTSSTTRTWRTFTRPTPSSPRPHARVPGSKAAAHMVVVLAVVLAVVRVRDAHLVGCVGHELLAVDEELALGLGLGLVVVVGCCLKALHTVLSQKFRLAGTGHTVHGVLCVAAPCGVVVWRVWCVAGVLWC